MSKEIKLGPVCPDGPRGCESYVCRPDKEGVWRHPPLTAEQERYAEIQQLQQRIAELEALNASLQDRCNNAERDYLNAITAGVNVTIPRLESKLTAAREAVENLPKFQQHGIKENVPMFMNRLDKWQRETLALLKENK